MNFRYYLPVKTLFGRGVVQQLGDFVSTGKVLCITDTYMVQSGVAASIASSLPQCEVVVFSDTEPNPSCETADAAAHMARNEQVSSIIALGGGSCLDTAKAVACLASNEGRLVEYLDQTSHFANTRLPLVAIPTTAGTGSEVTNVGVFTDAASQMKRPFVSDHFWCDLALVDPDLTLTLPPGPTASTGLDALCHAIESYWALQSSPVSEVMSKEAVALVMTHLITAYKEPQNQVARQGMALASLMAGMAFSQTRTTVLHAISFPLTNRYGLDHGAACAIGLPAFIRWCWTAIPEKLDHLAKSSGFDRTADFATAVEELMVSIRVPTRLRDIGVERSDLEYVADAALRAPVIGNTPRQVNKENLMEMLGGMY